MAVLGTIALFIFIGHAREAGAVAATLDPAFGGDGRVITSIGGDAEATAMVEDSKNRLVVAGSSGRPGDHDLVLARYLKDGSLDPAFGSAGIARTDLGADERGLALALDSQGRIIIAGSRTTANRPHPLVVRYSPDGMRDPAYTAILPRRGSAFSVAVDSRDRPIIAGGPSAFAARLGPDASLDRSFGSSGIAVFPRFGFAYGVATTGSGFFAPKDLSVFALCDHHGRGRFAAARLTEAGNLDPGFGSGFGVVEIFAGRGACARSIAPVPGSLLLAGDQASPDRALVARLTPDGSLDENFSDDGKTAFGFPGGRVSVGAVAKGVGRIVVAGSFVPSGGGRGGFAVAELKYGGELNEDFGGDGRIVTRFGRRYSSASATAVVFDQFGRIPTVAGFTSRSRGRGRTSSFALSRYGAPSCLGRGVTIMGTSIGDRLLGTPGPDVIDGKEGSDRIIGRGGDDRICGGSGSDRIDGGAGNDLIVGNGENDRILGGAGADRIQGGDKADSIVAGSGNDIVHGGADRDRIFGGTGNDRLFGEADPDVVAGGRGNDLVDGGPAPDRVSGGPGRDRVIQGPLGPPTATYVVRRPGRFFLFLFVKGNHIEKVRLAEPQRCSNGSTGIARIQTDDFNVPINPRTGRFEYAPKLRFIDYTSDFGLRGRVGRKAIVGTFYDRDYTALGGDPYRCWTGRSYHRPGVRFRAARR